MAISCNPSDLAEAAKQFQKLHPEHKQWIDTYLLALIAGGSTDPSVLALAAKQFQNIDPGHLKMLMVYLLCQIVNNGGSGSVQDMKFAWTPTGAKLGELMGYRSLNGGLSGITSITFSGVSSRGFDLEAGTALTTLSFPNLTSVVNGDLIANGLAALTSLTAPLLATITGGSFYMIGSGSSSLSLPALTNVDGAFSASLNASLVSISLPLLLACGGDFDVHGSASLTTLTAPNLGTVAGNLDLSSCAFVTVSLAGLGVIHGGLNTSLNAALVSLTFAGLTTVDLAWDASICPNLTTLSIPVLAACGDMNFTGTKLTTFNAPLLAVINTGGFEISGTTLTTISLPSLGNIPGNFTTFGATNLVTITAPGMTFTTDGITVDCRNCTLNAASVNNILHRCVVSGLTTSTIKLQGGTNAAPTGQGAIDKTTLQGLGNSVTTN